MSEITEKKLQNASDPENSCYRTAYSYRTNTGYLLCIGTYNKQYNNNKYKFEDQITVFSTKLYRYNLTC